MKEETRILLMETSNLIIDIHNLLHYDNLTDKDCDELTSILKPIKKNLTGATIFITECHADYEGK